MSAVPEPDGFRCRMFRLIYKKARDLYLSLIPHTGPSHCPLTKDKQRRGPR